MRAVSKRLQWLGLCMGVPLVIIFALRETRNDCEDTPVAEAISPHGAWRAEVVDSLCGAGFVWDITASVHLVSTTKPDEGADILGVDTGGHHDNRPRITWTAPEVLEVTVPNISYVKVLT